MPLLLALTLALLLGILIGFVLCYTALVSRTTKPIIREINGKRYQLVEGVPDERNCCKGCAFEFIDTLGCGMLDKAGLDCCLGDLENGVWEEIK